MLASRVGLSSPQVISKSTWLGTHRRQGSGDAQHEEISERPSSISSSSPGNPGSFRNDISGLQSLPRSNSDTELPHLPQDQSLMNESPPPSLISSPEYIGKRNPLSRPVSEARPSPLRSISMSSSTSSNGLADSVTRTLRPKRGKTRSGVDGFGSTPPSLGSSLRNDDQSPHFGIPGTLCRQSSSASTMSKRRLFRSSTSSTLSRRSPLPDGPDQAGEPDHDRRSSKSFKRVSSQQYHPASSHNECGPDGSDHFVVPSHSLSSKPRSYSEQADPSPRDQPPPLRYDRDELSRASSSTSRHKTIMPEAGLPIQPDPSPQRLEQKSSPKHTDADKRIEEAEERLRESLSRRTQTPAYPLTSPTKSDIHRRDSYSHTRGFEAAPYAFNGGTTTIRRSATLSSASSVARTPKPEAEWESNLQEHSGGSGGSKVRRPLPASFRYGNNSLFTPSPKSAYDPQLDSYDQTSPTASLSKLNRASRSIRDKGRPSTLSPAHLRGHIDGLERSSSVSSRTGKQWTGSPSGLPERIWDDSNQDRNGAHSPHRRYFGTDSSLASKRHNRFDPDVSSGLSRLNLGPSDSVSAVGMRSEQLLSPISSKDPLEVLRRMEASRAEHNRQWEVERSASVLGNRRSPQTSSGSYVHVSPQRVRPATSMASLRDNHPRTAPLDRVRRQFDDIPSLRSGSRLSYAGPSSEPRQMRSYTSLGSRTSESVDVNAASSEHGRLLFEAAHALGIKLPPDVVAPCPDVHRVINSAVRAAETTNATSRIVLQHVTRLLTDAEFDIGADKLLRELRSIVGAVRENNRASDQTVRDLTRILLDLPKLLGGRQQGYNPPSASNSEHRSYSRLESSDRGSVRPLGSPHGTPTRRKEGYLRPATSLEGVYAGDRRRDRESLPADFGLSDQRGGYVSRLRGFGGNTDHLDPIEHSPPTQRQDLVPDTPLSPLRRILKKKASSSSTYTVRGNTFMPSASKAPLTAISPITAGEGSPATASFDRMSIRSVRSKKSQPSEGTDLASNPQSRFSFYTAEETSPPGRRGNDVDGNDEVLSGLVEAQKRREESGGDKRPSMEGLRRSASLASGNGGEGRRWSVTDRVKKTFGR